MKRILIANRGEIVCRVARTARRLGIETVAVYSDADAGALHVRSCDTAVRIGAADVAGSYLNIDAIVDAASYSGADALHPGYGLLSENADFAERVAAAGVLFIGPRPETIRRMGNKVQARELVGELGLRVPPGSRLAVDSQDDAELAARNTGYPLLIKASEGGGGIGMTIVATPDALQAAIERARRTALRAFGSDAVYLERYFADARHVEVQVLGDGRGGAIALGDRDCSVQRRHQKVMEESPAHGLTENEHRELAAAAVAIAKSVSYLGAGTVEFLRGADGQAYFLEMNTRLQVEHPVTEAVLGLDLVEWQIRLAEGEALEPIATEPFGHAIECRVYAEDPHTMLPSPGTIQTWRMPSGKGIRVDSGFEAGMEVTRYYDPMLAKIVAWGADRDTARVRLLQAVGEAIVTGVRTNLPVVADVLVHPNFVNGTHTTGILASLRA